MAGEISASTSCSEGAGSLALLAETYWNRLTPTALVQMR